MYHSQVRVHFQKKLLLVELSDLSEDAQTEVRNISKLVIALFLYSIVFSRSDKHVPQSD